MLSTRKHRTWPYSVCTHYTRWTMAMLAVCTSATWSTEAKPLSRLHCTPSSALGYANILQENFDINRRFTLFISTSTRSYCHSCGAAESAVAKLVINMLILSICLWERLYYVNFLVARRRFKNSSMNSNWTPVRSRMGSQRTAIKNNSKVGAQHSTLYAVTENKFAWKLVERPMLNMNLTYEYTPKNNTFPSSYSGEDRAHFFIEQQYTTTKVLITYFPLVYYPHLNENIARCTQFFFFKRKEIILCFIDVVVVAVVIVVVVRSYYFIYYSAAIIFSSYMYNNKCVWMKGEFLFVSLYLPLSRRAHLLSCFHRS